MALTHNNRFGQTYEFGVSDADAPVIPGFTARKLELKYAPEVEEKTVDGEGMVDSVVTTKPDRRMITVSVSGFITDIDAYRTAAASFSFFDRFFIISNVSEPRDKGKTVEGTVEAYSHYNVTGAAA